MTAPLMVDAEAVIRAWVEQQTGVPAVTETPGSLGDHMPLFQVVRIGGGDDAVTLDLATISLHAYATGATGSDARSAARTLAYQGRVALYAARGVVFDGAVVTRVRTIGGPAWTPYDNTTLRRFTGTYQVAIKPA